MSDEATRLRPPKRVIVVVVLAYISGVVDIIAGVLLILLRYDDSVRASGDAFPITLWGARCCVRASGPTPWRSSAAR